MSKQKSEIIVTIEFTDQEAWDLAQFLKRIGYSEFRSNAVDDDEAYRMQKVTSKLRLAINELGYNPR
jgi:hypothetical protein